MTEDDRQRLRTVFAAYGEVAGVWLFGPHARGTASARSDVDLAVDPAAGTGGGARRRKLDMLTDLVGAGFDNVDLVILDTDDPVLRFEAIAPNVLVHAAPGYDPAEAFVQALRQYDDTAPLRARSRAAYYERLLRRDAGHVERYRDIPDRLLAAGRLTEAQADVRDLTARELRRSTPRFAPPSRRVGAIATRRRRYAPAGAARLTRRL